MSVRPGAATAALGRARRLAREPLPTRAAIAMVAVAGLVAAVVILVTFRGSSFVFDEWDFIQDRRAWNPDAFLAAHNEHLVLVQALVFKLLFAVFGLTSYWPYAVVLVATHLAAAGVLFALLRSWSSNEVAVLGTSVMLFLGSGYGVLLWAFQVGVTVSLAAGLGAVLALERRTPGGDRAACGLLALSLASASLGIPFVAGAAAMLVARPGWPRRIWVAAVPAALWGAWYLAYGHSTAQAANVPRIPVYVADGVSAALAGVSGLSLDFGRALLVATAIAAAAALVAHRADRDRVMFVALAAGVMWSLLCLTRFGVGTPGEPRYVYPGAAFVLLLLAALVGDRPVVAPRARVIALVLVAASLTTNIGILRDGGRLWRDYSAQVQAALGAMTEIRDHVPADFAPQPKYAWQIRADRYFAAVDALGSPAWSAAEIRSASPAARAAADDVLRRAGAVTIEAAADGPAGRPPAGVAVEGGAATPGPGAGCITLMPAEGAAMVARLPVPAGGLRIRSADVPAAAPIGVRLSRFADVSGDPTATLPPDGAPRLISARWTATASWRLEASSATPVVLCGG